MSRVLRLGTRASLLATAQSRIVADALEAAQAELRVELVPITTRGDRNLSVPLAQAGDPDFFSAELDAALLAGDVDFCVHSLKDLPDDRPAEIALAALPSREDPRDVIVFRGDIIDRLRAGRPLRLGSSSTRRQGNVADFLADALPATGTPPALEFHPLRGAVDRRLARIGLAADDPAALDGVILALAGLNRLWNDHEGRKALESLLRGVRFMVLPLSRCPAAAGQGILAVECRADDATTRPLLRSLDDPVTTALAALERRSLLRLPAEDRAATGATAVVHDVLGPLCFVRGSFVRGRATTGEATIDGEIDWQRPPSPAGRVIAWNGIAWQRACSRRPLAVQLTLPERPAIFVAYWHAATDVVLPPDVRLWVSGTESWRRLAARGLWVEGCGDNLGFEAITPTLACPVLGLPPLREWTALTSTWAVSGWSTAGVGSVVPTYEILPPAEKAVATIREDAARATHCYWSSPEQFRAIGPALPQGIHHACGAGKTLSTLRAAGIDATPFPDSREWQRWLT